MRKIASLALAVAFLAGLFVSPAHAAAAQTYTVLVGAEDSNRGIDVMSYFPGTLYVHVGDSVRWVQNTFEIHTVTFMAGVTSLPDVIVPANPNPVSPIMFNPEVVFQVAPAGGQYDGVGFVNSGLMGKEAGQRPEFTLTFTKAGTYDYLCLIHGMGMSGKIIVVPADVSIPSPEQVMAAANAQVGQALASASNLFLKANALVKPPSVNPDGSKTYTVNAGYMEGNVALMHFFPSQVVVRPGDTVVWDFAAMNMAPHTVSFLNGAAEPDFALPYPDASNPTMILVNPAVLFPAQLGVPLTRQGYYNSGIRGQGLPFPLTYATKIGSMTGRIDYECLLHDSSGMKASLVVVP